MKRLFLFGRARADRARAVSRRDGSIDPDRVIERLRDTDARRREVLADARDLEREVSELGRRAGASSAAERAVIASELALKRGQLARLAQRLGVLTDTSDELLRLLHQIDAIRDVDLGPSEAVIDRATDDLDDARDALAGRREALAEQGDVAFETQSAFCFDDDPHEAEHAAVEPSHAKPARAADSNAAAAKTNEQKNDRDNDTEPMEDSR